MMNCWQNEPEARPSFTDLTKQLKDMENQHKVGLLVPCDIKYFSDISNDNNFSAIRLTTSSNVNYNSGRVFLAKLSTTRVAYSK